MYTPYDWQEGIGNRAQFIEARLAQGAPVLAVSLEAGILFFTYRRQARKIYEIYDRLVYAGIGQQSDVESLRIAALEFCSREGYSRSEEDVTIARVANAMSAPIKRAFSDFGAAPVVAKSLFAEVNESVEADLYYAIDYDGDYATSGKAAVIAGRPAVAEAAKKRLAEITPDLSPDEAVAQLAAIWKEVVRGEDDADTDPTEGLIADAVLVMRSDARENRFTVLEA